MTVKLVTVTPRYIGTSEERQAMNPVPEHIGAEFFESNTGLTYVYCGESTWALKLYPNAAPSQ